MYNAEGFIYNTLLCAKSQTWPRVETIIVDDGSTDDSIEVARQFESENVKIICQDNRGAPVARSRGLKEAKGEFIQFLDADDLMEADKIETQVQRLNELSSNAVAAARWTRFYHVIGDGPHPPIPDKWPEETPLDWLIKKQGGQATMPVHGWLTPRSIIEEVGPWNENLRSNQDGEYFSRILLEAEKIVFCPDTAVYYRSNLSDSISWRNSRRALRSQLNAAQYSAHRMLRCEDSSRVRNACAYSFEEIAFRAYPAFPEIALEAWQRCQELGESDFKPDGGLGFRLLGCSIGWKRAVWLRHYFRRFRNWVSVM